MPDPDGVQQRRLNDGRTFRIVKLFRQPDQLTNELQVLGWQATVGRTSNYFAPERHAWPKSAAKD